MQYTKEKGSYVYKLQVSEDLKCIVAWHLLKVEFNRKRKIKSNGLAIRSQRLKPSTNQYRWEGKVLGDETSKFFYSDNVKLVQRLTYNHALQVMRKRLKAYSQILEGVTHG